TDLERKCRFLLGGGILLLMTLSFWGYARQTEGLAYQQMETSGRLLVPPLLANMHLEADRREAINAFQQTRSEANWPDELSKYQYKVLRPDAPQPEQKPEGDEVAVVNKMLANPAAVEESAKSAQGLFHYYGAIRAQ